MNLFCYESFEAEFESSILTSTFSNVSGKQIVETIWFYDSNAHTKTMVGQLEKGVSTLKFTLVREACLKIQVDYNTINPRESLVRYRNETGDHACRCPVIVQEDKNCTTMKICA
jgi:hypothetical protein